MDILDKAKDFAGDVIGKVEGGVSAADKALVSLALTAFYTEAAENALSRLAALHPLDQKYGDALEKLWGK